MTPLDPPAPAGDSPQGEPGDDSASPRPRKVYEPPAFAREQLFETMALACGKLNPSSGQCRSFRKNS